MTVHSENTVMVFIFKKIRNKKGLSEKYLSAY